MNRHRYALELPDSKQNLNFKTKITRFGRDLILLGALVCLIRTGYISRWMTRQMTQTKEVPFSFNEMFYHKIKLTCLLEAK